MKYLIAVAALGLCTSVLAESVIISRDGSTVSSGRAGSVILDNQSSVTSSTTTDSTGVSSSSIVGRTGSMCSTTHAGQRCEISCQAPQVAQCEKDANAAGPTCYCK